ncbi:hypothetical protein GFM44_09810 [Rhizobium leguminosarum bv. viciae]|nr:hypothetical protein [Rhizobium leguminosarum bv. viciae]
MRRKGYAQKRAIAEADDPDEQFDQLAESIGNAPVFQLRHMELFASAAFCSARAGVLHQTAEIRDKVGGAAFSRSSIKLAGYRYSRLPAESKNSQDYRSYTVVLKCPVALFSTKPTLRPHMGGVLIIRATVVKCAFEAVMNARDRDDH